MATSPVATSPIVSLRSDGQPRNHHRAHSNSHPPPAASFASYYSADATTHQEVTNTEAKEREEQSKRNNRVLAVLMRRLGHSKTFGENIIFMLNRSRKYSHRVVRSRTDACLPIEDNAEDICVQLLILKILYLLFTTPGTQEYFFTNDLRVLVDVFIRELVDLPDESEAVSLEPVLNTKIRGADLRAIATPYISPRVTSPPNKYPAQENSIQARSNSARASESDFK